MGLISSELKVDTSIIKNGSRCLKDELAPSYIDMKNPKFILIDGIYLSSLIVVNYEKEMDGGFLDKLLSLDVDFSISAFYEKQNTNEVIKEITYCIGNTGAGIKSVNENQSDIDIMAGTYGDAKYIRKALQVGNEELYYLSMYIMVYANTLEDLESSLQKIEGTASGIGLATRRAIYRQNQALLSSLPIFNNDKNLRESAQRNVLTSGLAGTYPFLSNEIYDKYGIVIGVNELNKSIVMIDRFNQERYKNANLCVIGTSGSGKSYFVKMMIARNRYMNISQYVIDPDREYTKLVKMLNGEVITFSGNECINIFDIRESSREESNGYLQSKIQKLNTFFELLFKDITLEEKAHLEEAVIETYKLKNITFNDDSLYKIDNSYKILSNRKFKESTDMPILEDLYSIMKKDKILKRLVTLMKKYISGSMKNFNNYTNVNVLNKLVVADIYDVSEENILPVMYIITEFYWDKIKEERNEQKIIYLDEVWKLINNSPQTAQFVFNIFKTIRKYGGAATAVTQDVNDFFMLDEGKYGRGIINNSSMKCIFQLEENELQLLDNVMQLSDEEKRRIRYFGRGECLIYANRDRVITKIIATKSEHECINTDTIKNEGGIKYEKDNNSVS